MKIEDDFAAVEKIIAEMESPDTGLEKSFALYQKGIEVLKDAGSAISAIEEELTVLKKEDQEENYGL